MVTAVFYNFSAERVHKAVPAIWDIATPAEMLRVRLDTAVAALRGYGLTDETPGVAEAAELAGLAARGAPLDGRPLFAANLALPWPDSPLACLWHAATLLREHRGDGHVAILVGEGISGRESNVFHVAAGAVPADFIKRSRDYSDEEWDTCVHSLGERGLLTPACTLTDAGTGAEGPRRIADRHPCAERVERPRRRRGGAVVPGAHADHPAGHRRR